MGWVNERLEGTDSSQLYKFKFLALKGSSFYIFSTPPVKKYFCDSFIVNGNLFVMSGFVFPYQVKLSAEIAKEVKAIVATEFQ